MDPFALIEIMSGPGDHRPGVFQAAGIWANPRWRTKFDRDRSQAGTGPG